MADQGATQRSVDIAEGALARSEHDMGSPPMLRARLRSDVTGAQVSTFAIGGPFESFIEAENEAELATLLEYLSGQKLPYRILGAGSNLLISSQGLSGITIRLGRGFRTLRALGSDRFEVGAAYSLMALSRQLSEEGFSGLEFAGGIPASIGGAVVMNAGAHGSEMAQLTEHVQIVLADGSSQQISAHELHFAYRRSELPQGAIVVRAQIRLSPGDRTKIAALRRDYLTERKTRQPLQSPSAGSVFRNPSPERTAGMLIEQAGLKGASRGGAQVSLQHANWIVNNGRTATDENVWDLVQHCQAVVQERFGIGLQPELIRWAS